MLLWKRDCARGLSAVFPQALWRLGAGHQAEGPLVLERLPGCTQLTVFGLLSVPVLCLHVTCHHLWGVTRRSHWGTHSKNFLPLLMVPKNTSHIVVAANSTGGEMAWAGTKNPESFGWITMYSDFIPSSNTVLDLEQTHFCLNINFRSWLPSWIACCSKDGK